MVSPPNCGMISSNKRYYPTLYILARINHGTYYTDRRIADRRTLCRQDQGITADLQRIRPDPSPRPVEVEWLKALAANAELPEITPLSNAAIQYLDDWVRDFSLAGGEKDKGNRGDHQS